MQAITPDPPIGGRGSPTANPIYSAHLAMASQCRAYPDNPEEDAPITRPRLRPYVPQGQDPPLAPCKQKAQLE